MALLLNPLPDTELVLSGSEELRLLLGVDTALNEVGLPVEFLAHGSREQVLARVGLTAQRITQDTVAQVLGAKVPYARPVPEDAAAPHHQEQA